MENTQKEENLFERTDMSNDFNSGPLASAPEREQTDDLDEAALDDGDPASENAANDEQDIDA